jgi:hypothetical protein
MPNTAWGIVEQDLRLTYPDKNNAPNSASLGIPLPSGDPNQYGWKGLSAYNGVLEIDATYIAPLSAVWTDVIFNSSNNKQKQTNKNQH